MWAARLHVPTQRERGPRTHPAGPGALGSAGGVVPGGPQAWAHVAPSGSPDGCVTQSRAGLPMDTPGPVQRLPPPRCPGKGERLGSQEC